MSPRLPKFNGRRWIGLTALLALGIWTAMGLSRDGASRRAALCEPHAKAAATCRPASTDEASMDARCVSHGRGGRICFDRAE